MTWDSISTCSKYNRSYSTLSVPSVHRRHRIHRALLSLLSELRTFYLFLNKFFLFFFFLYFKTKTIQYNNCLDCHRFMMLIDRIVVCLKRIHTWKRRLLYIVQYEQWQLVNLFENETKTIDFYTCSFQNKSQKQIARVK